MKSVFKVLVLSLTLIICAVVFSKEVSAQRSHVSFQLFYDQLSPYGEWVDYHNYGYVWIPDVGSNFRPYSTNGHWILTNSGWTWVSNYEWGWAPFHYGRWDYDNYYGWFWVPDTHWAPAWVTWRRANGYYGWAPMEPGFSISISFGRAYNRNNDHWSYVRYRDIDRPDIYRYSVNQNYNSWLYRNSRPLNSTYIDRERNTTYVYGPERADVQKVTGRKFKPVAIRENTRPGQSRSNGQLGMYRPEVSNNNARGQKPIPSRITNLKEVKRPSERKGTHQPRNESPTQNNRQEQRPTTVNQRNNNNNAKPVQPRNVNPSQNNRREQQQRTVNPQKNNNLTPVQPRNVNPQQNNRRERQPNAVNQQKKNNLTPVQPRNVNPQQNNNRGQQQNSAKPSNNNRQEQPKENRSERNKNRKD